MGLVQRVQQWIRGDEPTLIDYESTEPASIGGVNEAVDGALNVVLGRVGPGGAGSIGSGLPLAGNPAGTYKIQQSYDSLLSTVQELRAALDGQARQQEELLSRLSTLPAAVEALPQTSKMQSDMLKMINDRLSMHADQQRQVSEVAQALGPAKKEYANVLATLRDQIEMGNEIDRQLVESFNRFSMMIDRLQLANHHAVDALQQVRDSYAASAMQMQEWIEKSRNRNGWMIGGAFLMAGAALVIALILLAR
jgi:small-conductance mechanosensitive channel